MSISTAPQALGSIDESTVEEIAREADADPRSVIKKLAGLGVRGRAGQRIDRVLAERRERTGTSR